MLVVCGGAATGKTRLAHAVAELADLSILSSDVVRKHLAGVDLTERAPPGEYTPGASLRTYAELGRRASEAAARGGVIVDATFRRRTDRDSFSRAYGGPAPVFIECRAPAAVLTLRAAARTGELGVVSDATPEIVERQQAELEPLDEVAPRAT